MLYRFFNWQLPRQQCQSHIVCATLEVGRLPGPKGNGRRLGFLHNQLHALQLFEKLPLKKFAHTKMIPKPIRPLATVAAVITGGLITLNLASTATIKAIRFVSEAKRVKLKSQTISGSQTFFFLSFSLLLVFLLLSLVFLVGFCAEKGGVALWGLQRKRVLYMQIVQRKCHHRVVAYVWPCGYQSLPLPHLRRKQVALWFYFIFFNLLELYFKCLVYNFSFVLCLVAEKTISSLLFYKLNCRKNALNRFG